MKKNIHVVPEDTNWSVKKEGAQRATTQFDTKKEAMGYARELALDNEVNYVIHKADGTFQDERTPRASTSNSNTKSSATARDPAVHVVPHGTNWDVKTEGSSRAARHFETKAPAVEYARELALRNDVDYVVHGADGTVQDWRTPQESTASTSQEYGSHKSRVTTDNMVTMDYRTYQNTGFATTPTALHVVPYHNGWAISKEKGTMLEEYGSKWSAIGNAQRKAMEQDTEVVVHASNGEFQSSFHPNEDGWRPALFHL